MDRQQSIKYTFGIMMLNILDILPEIFVHFRDTCGFQQFSMVFLTFQIGVFRILL